MTDDEPPITNAHLVVVGKMQAIHELRESFTRLGIKRALDLLNDPEFVALAHHPDLRAAYESTKDSLVMAGVMLGYFGAVPDDVSELDD